MSYAYQLRAGTLAWRAMNWLRTFLADDDSGEISTTAWATGLQVTTPELISAMQPVLKARLVFSRQKGGHIRSPLFWSLVDHTRKEYTPERGSQHVVKAEGASPDATDRETPAMQRPGVGPTGTGQPADAGAACDWVEVSSRLKRAWKPRQAVDLDDALAQIDAPSTEPKGLAGAARGLATAEQTTHRGAAHNGAGEDATRDGGPASPGGLAVGTDVFRQMTSVIEEGNARLVRRLRAGEAPAVARITLSIECTPHQAERITQFVRSMTESLS